MPSDLAVDLTGVEKRYRGNIYALRGIDLAVRRGEIFGLLGPNGAGKSTLVKIMMSVIRPTAASGTVLGQPVGDKPTLSRVGYLPENHRFPRHLTGRQVLNLFAALAGVPRNQRRSRSDELLQQVDMTIAADRRVSTYSKGMLQRIGLAQAMMNTPDLIVLDEPTDGVDPIGRMQIRTVLQTLRSRGTTVFINSHLLSELESLCDRVAILLNGTVAAQGSLDELSVARQRYEIELHDEGMTIDHLAALAITWTSPTHGTFPDGTWTEFTNGTLRIGTTDPHQIQPTLDQLRTAGLVIRRLQMVRPTLEELFVEAVARQSPPLPV
jgi:ABC-2 type transport system ATP-binding protein